MVIERPQDTYIRILYKINDGYSSFQIKQDLIKTIGFYSNKHNYAKEELEELERVCKTEWQKAIALFCDIIINTLENNSKNKEIMCQEINEAKELKEKAKRNNLDLAGYESIFDNDFVKLDRKVRAKLYEQKWENKKFWQGIGIGFILGMGGTIALHYIFGIG